jgi:hypothetical protein
MKKGSEGYPWWPGDDAYFACALCFSGVCARVCVVPLFCELLPQ